MRSELTLRDITLTLFGQKYCYEKYDITGGDVGKKRQEFLPDKFTDQVICAGSNVSSSFSEKVCIFRVKFLDLRYH